MEAKFLKRLSDYKYALVCDLAQYESGFALLDVSTNALIEVQQISVSRTTDQPTGEMYQMFDEMVNDFLDRYNLQAEDLSGVVALTLEEYLGLRTNYYQFNEQLTGIEEYVAEEESTDETALDGDTENK